MFGEQSHLGALIFDDKQIFLCSVLYKPQYDSKNFNQNTNDN